MAKKARDPVQFTYESAERIARVVRAAELMPSPASALSFAKRMQERSTTAIRAARFSGAWPIGTQKVVTLAADPQRTFTVTNTLWPIQSSNHVNEDCIIGKDGSSWLLLAPRLEAELITTIGGYVNAIIVLETEPLEVVTEVKLEECAITTDKEYITSVSSQAPGIGVTSVAQKMVLLIANES